MQIMCKECGYESIKVEDLLDVSLEIHGSKTSVCEAFRNYTAGVLGLVVIAVCACGEAHGGRQRRCRVHDWCVCGTCNGCVENAALYARAASAVRLLEGGLLLQAPRSDGSPMHRGLPRHATTLGI